MSKKALDKLKAVVATKVLEATDFRGDDTAIVDARDWREVATVLRDDPDLAMDHFTDLTAVDYPDRDARFDVLLLVRSLNHGHRLRLKTRVADGQALATLTGVWAGANWAEREVYDMFGIRFEGHPDLRRILMYEQFEGHPLRKDYPIDRVQPLIPYREAEDIEKLPPFGPDQGQPFARNHWGERLAGRDRQVSPAIGVQAGTRRSLSDSDVAVQQATETSATAAPATGGAE